MSASLNQKQVVEESDSVTHPQIANKLAPLYPAWIKRKEEMKTLGYTNHSLELYVTLSLLFAHETPRGFYPVLRLFYIGVPPNTFIASPAVHCFDDQVNHQWRGLF